MKNVKNAIKGLVFGMVVVIGCLVNSNVAKAETINTDIVNSTDTQASVTIDGNTYSFYCDGGWNIGDLCAVEFDNGQITGCKPYVNEYLYDKNTNEPTMIKLDTLINNGTLKIDNNDYANVLKNILYRDNNNAMTHYTVDGSWYMINEYNGSYGCYNSVNGDTQWFKGEEDLIQYMKDNWVSDTGKMNR